MNEYRTLAELGKRFADTAKNRKTSVPGKEETIRNMKQKVFDFGCFYEDYYRDKRDDEDITKVATQPYWQSMRLNKRRLVQNGIKMDIDIRDEGETRIDTVDFEDNGKNIVGTFMRKVKVDKTFTKEGKVLYHKKNKLLCISSALQASGEGEMAACPNCGHMGTIYSYIDGCDYCNSKFAVDEFEEKISSFRLEEDNNKRIRKLFKRIISTTAVLVVLFIALLIASIAISIKNSTTHSNYKESFNAGIVFFAAVKIVPMLMSLIFISVVIFMIFACIYMRRHYTRVEENQVYYEVKNRLPGSTAEKFAQDLEYKLRNIHFAEHPGEVQAFANIDLSEVVEKYRDVIECNLVKIIFLKKEKTAEGCNLTLKVGLKLARVKDSRVIEENEQLILTMSAKDNMKAQEVGAVRMYCCSNCGASVSLLEGGICGYCGTKLDYSEYGWMIEKYYSNISEKEASEHAEKIFFGRKKYMNVFEKIKIKLAIIYLGLFLAGAGSGIAQNWTFIQRFLRLDKYIECVETMYDGLKTMGELQDEVVQTKFEDGYFERSYFYDCNGDVQLTVQEYTEYLKTEGYSIVDSHPDRIQLSKYTPIDKYSKIYHLILIVFQGDKIRVDYEMSEEER